MRMRGWDSLVAALGVVAVGFAVFPFPMLGCLGFFLVPIGIVPLFRFLRESRDPEVDAWPARGGLAAMLAGVAGYVAALFLLVGTLHEHAMANPPAELPAVRLSLTLVLLHLAVPIFAAGLRIWSSVGSGRSLAWALLILGFAVFAGLSFLALASFWPLTT
jgi:hypothetical protein